MLDLKGRSKLSSGIKHSKITKIIIGPPPPDRIIALSHPEPHPIRPLETFLVPSMHPNIPNIFTHSTHQWFGSHSIRATCARLNGEERQSRQVAGLLFRIDTFSRGEVFEEGVGNPIQCIIGKNINSLKECFKLDKTC